MSVPSKGSRKLSLNTLHPQPRKNLQLIGKFRSYKYIGPPTRQTLRISIQIHNSLPPSSIAQPIQIIQIIVHNVDQFSSPIAPVELLVASSQRLPLPSNKTVITTIPWVVYSKIRTRIVIAILNRRSTSISRLISFPFLSTMAPSHTALLVPPLPPPPFSLTTFIPT